MLDSQREFPIDELIASFPDGNNRFINSKVSLRFTWFPLIEDFNDRFSSNYAVTEDLKDEILSEFYTEIKTINEILLRFNIKPKLADWQKSDSEAVQNVYYGLNRNAMAFSIWDSFAVPLRLYGENVYRIWTPHDVMGSPIIKSIPLRHFIQLTALKTAEDNLLIAKKDIKINRLINIVGILSLVLLILFAIIFKNY